MKRIAAVLFLLAVPSHAGKFALQHSRWLKDGTPTHQGTPAEGRLLNVRMVNCTFDDQNPDSRPHGFNPDRNTEEFIAALPQYTACGVNAFSLGLQGGHPGYKGSRHSTFLPDGSLDPIPLARIRRVIEACRPLGAAVILGCFHQLHDQILTDEAAVRHAVAYIARWITDQGFDHVMLEIANEGGHPGFHHPCLKSPSGIASLIQLAKATAPQLLVSSSSLGHGSLPDETATAADFLLLHFNDTPEDAIPARLKSAQRHGKAIVVSEDDKTGKAGARALHSCLDHGASWGFLHKSQNQFHPWEFRGPEDDPDVYAAFASLSSPGNLFPPPESDGGWPTAASPEEIRQRTRMDPDRLKALHAWLDASDQRPYAAVIIRHGCIALEATRGPDAATSTARVASVSKAICATVLAAVSEKSRRGDLPRRMSFSDPAFAFLPQALPLSDPRKANITVAQLLNHTSGLCPEATGAPNDGSWDFILGKSGDPRTAQLAFDPGSAAGYSTHAFHHASLVCETVAGKPYDACAIDYLFRPLGISQWWFQHFDGSCGSHPSHATGLAARDLARIGYCFLHHGRWKNAWPVPSWFVRATASPSHPLTSPELRFQIPADSFSHGWELPARRGPDGTGIPADTRCKPGSGGQMLAFIPSLQLVIARHTGGSGPWPCMEFLRRACEATLPDP